MNSLQTAVDHPYLLIVGVVVSVPFLIWLAKEFFPDPEGDAEEDAKNVIWSLATDWPYSVIIWKFVAMMVVGGAFVIAFYKAGAWLMSWF